MLSYSKIMSLFLAKNKTLKALDYVERERERERVVF